MSDDAKNTISLWKFNYKNFYGIELTDKELYSALAERKEEMKKETIKGFFRDYRVGNQDHMDKFIAIMQEVKPAPEETIASVMAEITSSPVEILTESQVKTKLDKFHGKPGRRK